MRILLAAAVVVALLCAAEVFGADTADTAETELPPFPGMEEDTPAPPIPGSAPAGENPLNALHLDTMLLVEGLLAGGFGVGIVYERSLGDLLVVDAQAGYLHGALLADGESLLDVLSLLAGPRLSLLGSAVNGPNLGVGGGVALVRLATGGTTWLYAWPQFQADLGVKFSLGTQAKGFFLEPRLGYKVAIHGPESEGQAIPRYGEGLVAGLRLGISF